MSTINPYEPPKTRLREALSAEVGGDCWRDGKQLVVRPGCTLPGRCIKCNEPAEQPMKLWRFYWHHPALYLVALVNLLIYAVIALFVRRKTPVTVGLCKRHHGRRRRWIGLAMLGTVGGIGVFGLGAGSDPALSAVVGLGVVLLSLVAGILGSRVLVVTRIGENYTRFNGAGADFLETLPSFYRTK